MKKNVLLFLKTPTLQARKQAFTSLRDKQIMVLSQYGNTAMEVSVSDEESKLLMEGGYFSQLYDGPIDNNAIQAMTAEGRQIAETWNLTRSSATRDAATAMKDEAKRGLSWGTDKFDEPRPHTDISEDFFLKILQEKGIEEVRSRDAQTATFSKERVQRSFPGIQDKLMQKVKDPTRVYHLSRLAIIHPELEETILTLRPDVIDDLFKTSRTERSNLNAAMRGPAAAPEAPCWRMNGEISVGVVFVESSKPAGPVFSSADRTTLINEVQTGLNWLASQHPTGNLSWVFNYQYTKINVNNGTNSSVEDYWRNPAMQAVSYNGHSYTGDWNGVANYRNDMRTANDSAHAIVVFITPYGTDWHAYASNARLTLANRNNWGGWGIGTIDAITAHEVCHLFGAADEYTGSGTPCTSCTTKHGCDNVSNGNCKACAATPVPCIMDQNSFQLCSFTRGQIGWPSFDKWQQLDNNPATKTIVAAGANLYQLHNTGKIWKYTGVPMTGWQMIDNNPATVSIIAAGANLYQLHNTGKIWKYTGVPLTGWQMIDNNPATKAIVAADNNLYQLHNTGKIFKYTGVPLTGWQMLDNNAATVAIIAAGSNLYQLHNTGKIWKYTGVPLTGWQMLDNNAATKAIVADGSNLYQLHNTGKIWKYTGVPLTGWQMLDNNPATIAIVSAANHLIQLHNTGKIWQYTGTPLTGWQQLDNNAASKAIVAADNNLYQLHNTGKIWRFTGVLV